MIVKEIGGDLLNEFDKGRVQIMVHGCNCFHLMGAGIAGQIRYRYPKAYEADKTTPCGDINKLGDYSFQEVKRADKVSRGIIINMYTQFEPGARFEYKAFKDALRRLARDFKGSKAIFGFPQIGCGIGGGSWPYVKDILHKSKLKIVVVHYDNGIKTVGEAKANRSAKLEG
jgi:O-acetyl-ADP-ribose deacetylase (regulator of RNase III)